MVNASIRAVQSELQKNKLRRDIKCNTHTYWPAVVLALICLFFSLVISTSLCVHKWNEQLDFLPLLHVAHNRPFLIWRCEIHQLNINESNKNFPKLINREQTPAQLVYVEVTSLNVCKRMMLSRTVENIIVKCLVTTLLHYSKVLFYTII